MKNNLKKTDQYNTKNQNNTIPQTEQKIDWGNDEDYNNCFDYDFTGIGGDLL